jgi:hypothetical protein
LRRFWPAIPILALAIWAARLDNLRASHKADLAACQSARKVDHANAEAAAAKTEAGWARQQVTAANAQADREAARQPIIVRSTDTVREYAQTDAGRAVCRGPDRVRSIDALDAEIAEATRAASVRAGALHADATAPAAGR